MRPGVSWGVLGVSLGVLGCPGVIRPTLLPGYSRQLEGV